MERSFIYPRQNRELSERSHCDVIEVVCDYWFMLRSIRNRHSGCLSSKLLYNGMFFLFVIFSPFPFLVINPTLSQRQQELLKGENLPHLAVSSRRRYLRHSRSRDLK